MPSRLPRGPCPQRALGPAAPFVPVTAPRARPGRSRPGVMVGCIGDPWISRIFTKKRNGPTTTQQLLARLRSSERIAQNHRHISPLIYRKVRRTQSNHQGEPLAALAPHPLLDSCAGAFQRRALLRRISKSAPPATAHTTTSPPKKDPKTRAKIGKTARTRKKARTTRRTTMKRNRRGRGSGTPTVRAPA